MMKRVVQSLVASVWFGFVTTLYRTSLLLQTHDWAVVKTIYRRAVNSKRSQDATELQEYKNKMLKVRQ